ncbi:hypothetical protein [Chitinophaga sp.]|uniref:hypothetical protein n=1 Tax=Chitinophaga sp. TaxID=1869181 RepID=UPI0031D991CE
MKKQAIAIFVFLAIAIILTVTWKLVTFEMFEVTEISLASHPVKSGNYTVEIKYVTAGATTVDVMQVRKVHNDGKVDIVKNIEGYNDLIYSYLTGDSVLYMMIRDTGYDKSFPDTLVVKL